MFDIRDHGGSYADGNLIKINPSLTSLVKRSSYSLPYGTIMAYNDEKDNIIIMAYNNSTGGDYRLFSAQADGSGSKSSENLSYSIQTVARDNKFAYASFNNGRVIVKFSISKDGTLTRVATSNTKAYSINTITVVGQQLWCITSNSDKINIINSTDLTDLSSITMPETVYKAFIDKFDNTKIYIQSYKADGYLYCYDTITMEMVWRSSHLAGNPQLGSIAMTKLHVYVASNGIIKQYFKKTGVQLSTRSIINGYWVFTDYFNNVFESANNVTRWIGNDILSEPSSKAYSILSQSLDEYRFVFGSRFVAYGNIEIAKQLFGLKER